MAKRVLVVDDEADVLNVVAFRLKSAGYEVATAKDGREALDKVRGERFDLVLLDLRLPHVGGHEVCKEIKADEKLKGLPVILLTADSNKIVEAAAQINADDYIIKPFDHQTLLDKIGRFLKG